MTLIKKTKDKKVNFEFNKEYIKVVTNKIANNDTDFISKSFFLYAVQFLLIGHSRHKGFVGLQIKAPTSIMA